MNLNGFFAILRREFSGYFSTPVAYVFIAIFLFTIGAFSFYFGAFYEREQATLDAFFSWHPWLYLFFIPAISMRLWAEERKSGTIELLVTLPIPLWQTVAGKFTAAWLFNTIALAGTLPIWITVNYLGDPDNGVILMSYLGSMLIAGSYLAIGSCISALTRNQVIAFTLSVLTCFFFTVSGSPLVINFLSGWLSTELVNLIASFSLFTNFIGLTKGVLEISALLYFISLVALWLYLNTVILANRNYL